MFASSIKLDSRHTTQAVGATLNPKIAKKETNKTSSPSLILHVLLGLQNIDNLPFIYQLRIVWASVVDGFTHLDQGGLFKIEEDCARDNV